MEFAPLFFLFESTVCIAVLLPVKFQEFQTI